jgi:hypothetical protein
MERRLEELRHRHVAGKFVSGEDLEWLLDLLQSLEPEKIRALFDAAHGLHSSAMPTIGDQYRVPTVPVRRLEGALREVRPVIDRISRELESVAVRYHTSLSRPPDGS